MCFQTLPKLSVAGDLSYRSQQTVPDARSCDSEASVAESGTCAWNSECSVQGRRAEMMTTMLRDECRGNRGQWRSQEIFPGEQIQEVWGTEVPQWGPGAKPRWESGGEDDFTMKK